MRHRVSPLSDGSINDIIIDSDDKASQSRSIDVQVRGCFVLLAKWRANEEGSGGGMHSVTGEGSARARLSSLGLKYTLSQREKAMQLKVSICSS